MRFTTNLQQGVWITPKWKEVWFPDAFQGPMFELIDAISTGTQPITSGEDNLSTMALIEAGYRSLHEHRSVGISEIAEQRPATIVSR
jgi:predicted dehydrogenase